MSKHTPGPWQLAFEGRPTVTKLVRGSRTYLLEQEASDGCDNIAFISAWSSDEKDEALANARLIAAAPELLEPLQNLLHAYSEPDDRICCNGSMCGCQGSTKRGVAEHYAKEAIAKATGGAD